MRRITARHVQRPGPKGAGPSDSRLQAEHLIARTVTARGLPVHPTDPALLAGIAALYRRAI